MTGQLLTSLAMKETKISLAAEGLNRFAAHDWPKASGVGRQRWLLGEVCAFAGLTSTVPDLARFGAMHLGATAGQTTIREASAKF